MPALTHRSMSPPRLMSPRPSNSAGKKPFAKDFEQRICLLGGCNATEKNDLAADSG